VFLALFQGFALTFDADVGFEKGDFALTFDADMCALLFRKEDDVRYLLAVAPGFPHSNTDLASKYRTDLSTSPIYRRPLNDLCLHFNRPVVITAISSSTCYTPQPVTSIVRFGL
jgi:hypothetical protein